LSGGVNPVVVDVAVELSLSGRPDGSLSIDREYWGEACSGSARPNYRVRSRSSVAGKIEEVHCRIVLSPRARLGSDATN
jgi:hypothetical protein